MTTPNITLPRTLLESIEANAASPSVVLQLARAALATEPAQVALTDEELDSIVARSCKRDSSHLDAARVARAIEQAHGIGAKP